MAGRFPSRGGWVFLSLVVLFCAAAAVEAGTFVAFGPERFTRANGAPATTTASFAVRNPATAYTLHVEASSVSSAIVTLNGVEIFGTRDFNQQVTQLSKAVTLEATNTLVVELRGGPEEGFTIRVSGVDDDPPTIRASAAPAANPAGWNSGDVTVTFTCDDATSGVAVCPPARVVTTEGAAQSISGTAIDAAGNSATATAVVSIDKTAPVITITSPPDGATVSSPATIMGSAADPVSGVTQVTCGATTAPVANGLFVCSVPLVPGNNTIVLAASDQAGNAATASLTLRVHTAPAIHISEPPHLTFVNMTPITVRGAVSDPNALVTVGGIDTPAANGVFSVQVPIVEGNNTITAVAETGGFASTASVQVTLDTTAPRVTVQAPPDGFVTDDASIAVSGIVNDIVVGTVNEEQAHVTVNGLAAQVANRSFLANVPLAPGDNTIQVVGRDRVGNASTTRLVVRRVDSSEPRIRALGGDGQGAAIGTTLPQPLSVQLVDASGQPVANRAVVFKVTQSDGTLADGSGSPKPAIAVRTDAAGRADARFTLGMRAGAGNNRVEATSTGLAGTAMFVATATPGAAAALHLDAGSGQTGATGDPLPFPFVVVATDAGHNRRGGIPVRFRVVDGGGTFGGAEEITATTDSDGRALAVLTLGPDAGALNNVVEATVAGGSGPVVFAASAKVPGPAAGTRISGIVLDNANAPLPGVTMRLYRAYQAANSNIPIPIGTPVVTDDQGQFLMTGVPVGAFKLIADGTTVQRTNAAYPTVEYDIVTIAGQDNTVGMPVYLPNLDTVNRLCVSETLGGTLTLPSVPGFALTVAPGSATFPGASRSGCITVTPVHGDKVPMVPGFGQQPRFVITIQPAGTHFNPPAQLTLPNVDGLAPRQVTEMYSYDHDLSTFVAIGTGTVSADGAVIRSDPGVGVLKAGWHCGGDPQPTGAAANCKDCYRCEGNRCIPIANGTICNDDVCQECKDGHCVKKIEENPPFDPARATMEEVQPSKTSNALGHTEVEGLEIEFSARCDDGVWHPVLESLVGLYSWQINIPSTSKEPSVALATRDTFCMMACNLKDDFIGPSGREWVVRAAVEAHEAVHNAHFLPELIKFVSVGKDGTDGIEKRIETYKSVPTAPGKTEEQAVAELREALDYIIERIVAEYDDLAELAAEGDHGQSGDEKGPAFQAMRVITDPLRFAICSKAVDVGWITSFNDCKGCTERVPGPRPPCP